MFAFDSYFRSDIGRKRTNNEDFAGALEPSDAQQLIHSGRLYVVADGLGGHQQGEKASAHAVNTLLQLYYQNPKLAPEQRLRDIIAKINRDLIAYAQKNLPGEKVATTIVAAVVREDSLLVANVGDSRAYLLRNGEIAQITRDHSYVGEMLRTGAITEAEAQQSKFRNRLTRSVGGSDANLEVDVYPPIPLRPGDIILLCTDGLTQYATPQDLAIAVQAGSAREIGERLIQFANARGGSDNITVAVVKVGSPLARRKRDKTSKPGGKLLKTIAMVAAGALLLAALALLIGFVYTTRFGSSQPTTTPTVTATVPPATTAAPQASATPLSTATKTPSPSETATSADNQVDCEYTVKAGQTAGGIADNFGARLAQVFRQDGSRDNLDLINPGEILIIKDIPLETCLNGGGTAQPPTTTPEP